MSEPTTSGGPAAVARCLERRAELLGRPASAELASRNAAIMDELLRTLAAEASSASDPGKPWALVALGGYGAGRLLPHSDIDLLVTSEAGAERLKPFVSAVLYPLWDAGLKVGHSVRTRKEALAAAFEDPANLTAMLTARCVAGDPDVAGTVLGAVASQAARNPYAKHGALTLFGSRERDGSPYELWPDLKEGRGGQRDLDELAWTAAAVAGAAAAPFSALVAAGLLTDDECAALDRGQALVTTARWCAHRLRARGDNRFDEDVALEFTDSAELQVALVDIDDIHRTVRERIAAAAPRRPFAPKPGGPPAAPATPSEVLAALAEGTGSLALAETGVWHGALHTVTPEWRDLMVLRRPALSHRLTVGAHSMGAAALVPETLLEDPLARAAIPTAEDRLVVTVAALVHDVGKRCASDDHAAAGAADARSYALALGLDAAQTDKVGALVRHHLLFSESASSADIDDEDVVLDVADRLGDPELAGPLYVLTQVDCRATGPDVWTPWKASLIGELAGKVERVLNGQDATDITSRAALVRQRVIEEARFEPVAHTVVEFARRAPLRYLAEHTPEEVIAHARLAFSLSQGGRRTSAGVEVRPGSLADTWVVTVVALDRPGLLALFAGVFALTGLDILGVSAHTTSRGVALDTFTVTSATLAEVEPSTWVRFERSLEQALQDRLALAVRLAERRRHYRGAERSVAPRVKVETGDDFTTAFKVTVADRVGLLHDLALAVSDSGLDIRRVTAITSAGVARDTFRVVDEFGEPPRDPGLLEATRLALLGAAEGNAPSTDTGREA